MASRLETVLKRLPVYMWFSEYYKELIGAILSKPAFYIIVFFV